MIKSKKAKEAYPCATFVDAVGRSAFEKGYEFAESELYTEEQCIEAFKETCPEHIAIDGICIANGCRMDCDKADIFLSALKSLKQ